MYSDRELTRLSAYKAELRQRIARHRRQCVTAATRLAQPLAWLEHAPGRHLRLRAGVGYLKSLRGELSTPVLELGCALAFGRP